jgi:hypothetical protein
MAIAFYPAAADPHGPVRDVLDDVLSKGTSRIMVACAFCSGAGVAIMQPHLPRLRLPGSSLVVSAEKPTDIDAVNALAKQAPGRIWMHETGKLPTERGVGSALMHSKVFYAEAGDNCWLWVGSHNLTARAMTGANLEAAILLAGHPSEGVFQAARLHVEACRDESSLCPVESPPEPEGDKVDVVIVHAETDSLPGDPMPWHVRLGLRSAEFDWSLRPPAVLRLHLYRRGHLARGWRNATPLGSFGGTLTGLNFTDIHPAHPGMAARWDDEHYAITEDHVVLQFSKAAPTAKGIVTQAVINVDSRVPSDEAFLPAKPKVGLEEHTERRIVGAADDELARFFTRQSVQNGRLVYEVRHKGKASWSMSMGDLRDPDRLKITHEAQDRNIELLDLYEDSRARHPLIMRAKFRLR